jgi:hypothetical protein
MKKLKKSEMLRRGQVQLFSDESSEFMFIPNVASLSDFSGHFYILFIG